MHVCIWFIISALNRRHFKCCVPLMILGYQVVHQPRCHIRKKFFFFFCNCPADSSCCVLHCACFLLLFFRSDLFFTCPLFILFYSFIYGKLSAKAVNVCPWVCLAASVWLYISSCGPHTHTNPLNHSYNHTFVCVSIYPNALAALKLLCPVYAPSRTHILYS